VTLTNTHRQLLHLAGQIPGYGITAMDAARSLYPGSTQLPKKAKTMLAHLRTLGAAVYLLEQGGSSSLLYTELRFVLSTCG